jgi:hypothetical protein
MRSACDVCMSCLLYIVWLVYRDCHPLSAKEGSGRWLICLAIWWGWFVWGLKCRHKGLMKQTRIHHRHLHVPYAWYHLDKLATTKYRTKWMVVGVTEAIKCGCQLVPSYAIYLQIKVPGTTSMSPSRFPSINTVFLSLCSVWKQCVMCWLQLLQVAVKYFE